MKKRWPWLLLLLLLLLGLLLGALLLNRNTDSVDGAPTETGDPTEGTSGPGQTDAPTQPPTEPPTESPTEPPTEPPTEALTQPPTESGGPTQPTGCSHSWSNWTTQAATCDTNGVKTRKCSKCSKEETATIAATGHAWDEGKVTVKPTTCSDMGVITYTCKNCGKTKVSQVKGEHSFGAWTYEEYTYKNEAGASRPSHRKVRICEKCGYKEYGNTPDHYCAKGSANHTVTTVKAGTCTTKATMRSTCKVCGWYVDYDGKMGSHTITSKKVHLSDYTQYTNGLDATIDTCTSCGLESVIYHYGKGYNEYYRWRTPVAVDAGNAYVGAMPVNDDMRWVEHPTWQLVTRDHVYDAAGYVKQFTAYWHDKNGNRYSQVIKCGEGEIEAWYAECGMTPTGKVVSWTLKVDGPFIRPWRIYYQ